MTVSNTDVWRIRVLVWLFASFLFWIGARFLGGHDYEAVVLWGCMFAFAVLVGGGDE